MENKNLTAVEWLVDQLTNGKQQGEDFTVIKSNLTKLLEQAKKMEDEQYDHAFLYGKLYAEQNYTYTLDELTKMAEEVWEGCDGCDDNDKNFWINGFITGMNYKK